MFNKVVFVSIPIFVYICLPDFFSTDEPPYDFAVAGTQDKHTAAQLWPPRACLLDDKVQLRSRDHLW